MLYTLVFTALSQNVAVPLMIRWWKPRLIQDLEEKEGTVYQAADRRCSISAAAPAVG